MKINLLKDDIYELFWKIALPSSIGTIFQNLYSLVDAIFAGRMISETALAAIGQTFPIYFIIIAYSKHAIRNVYSHQNSLGVLMLKSISCCTTQLCCPTKDR